MDLAWTCFVRLSCFGGAWSCGASPLVVGPFGIRLAGVPVPTVLDLRMGSAQFCTNAIGSALFTFYPLRITSRSASPLPRYPSTIRPQFWGKALFIINRLPSFLAGSDLFVAFRHLFLSDRIFWWVAAQHTYNYPRYNKDNKRMISARNNNGENYRPS